LNPDVRVSEMGNGDEESEELETKEDGECRMETDCTSPVKKEIEW
jgi:hypothetical protein